MTRSWAFAFVLLAAGCVRNWGPAPSNLPTPLQSRTVVRIWSGSEVKKWHAVVITEAWVSGVPYTMPVTCDSCVLRIPRAHVDSMKVEHEKNLRGIDQRVAYVDKCVTAQLR